MGGRFLEIVADPVIKNGEEEKKWPRINTNDTNGELGLWKLVGGCLDLSTHHDPRAGMQLIQPLSLLSEKQALTKKRGHWGAIPMAFPERNKSSE
ncbi:MAG: hypothetical protein LAP21_23335 [Acidobacteriia bacterium]|nr:hypothetical protein [Terriglobia bacterium]